MSLLRSCPACGSSQDRASLFLCESIDQSRLSSFSFSSRKVPEFMSHRLVKCGICDLVYVAQPPNQSELALAYHNADYDSSEEASDAAEAYIEAIRPWLSMLEKKQRVLEIGAGTGIFLELLEKEGFQDLVGIEPSIAAIAAASRQSKIWLKQGIFDENDFEPESFDLICCFMTMEHVRDPDLIAASCLNLLRPGGMFVTVTHDYAGWINRLLGKKSPIIDIEHMQLFSKKSIRHLFTRVGYEQVAVSSIKNSYKLEYWLRLTPLHSSIKSKVAYILNLLGLTSLRVGVNVGNLITVGIKSA